MSSRIEQLIDEIEGYIDNCKYKAFSTDVIMVNKAEIDELIRELRIKTPEEIKRYQKIIMNKEAILNIIKNAIEHTDSGKNVTITLDENNVYSYIKIKDEGEGIPENELKHIFDRFYKTQNTKENSMGIGLALAKSIIEKQNGYIQVESKTNEGTTFIIKYLK